MTIFTLRTFPLSAANRPKQLDKRERSCRNELLIFQGQVVIENFSLGVRLGYAFGGGPEVPNGSAFLPVHAAGRVGYWFGSEPFGRTGLRPFVFLTGGMAQIDTRVLVTVYEGDDAYVNDQRTKLHAWRKAGSAFVGGGVGTSFLPDDSAT